MIFGSDGVGSVINNIKNVNSVLNDYNNAIGKRVYAQKAFNGEIESCSKSFGSYLKSLNGAEASMGGYVKSLVSAKLGTIALNVASAALEATITMGLSLAISFLVSKISDLVHYEEKAAEKEAELREEYVKTANEYKEEANAIDGLLDKYNSIASSTNNYVSKEKELLSLQNEIIDKYGEKAKGIDLVNAKYSDAIKLIRQFNLEEAKEYVDKADRTDSYKTAKERMTTSYKVTNSASKGFYDTGSAVLTAKGFGGWDFTSESTKILNSLGNIYWDNSKNGYGNVFRVQGTLEEQKKTLEDIVDIYKSQKKYDDDKVKILNDEIERLDTEITQYQTIINQYESAKKRIAELDIPEETQKKFDTLIEKAITLNEEFNNESSAFEKYNIIQDLKEVETELNQLSGDNSELKNIIDSTFSAFSTGTLSAMNSTDDLESAWYESFDEMQKGALSNVDKMKKAMQTLAGGGTISSSDFWDINELDTDRILSDITSVNGEMTVSIGSLQKLKDTYIKAQVEMLEAKKKSHEADKLEWENTANDYQKILDSWNFSKRSLNDPKNRYEYDDIKTKLADANKEAKKYGTIINKDNLLIQQLNSSLGNTVNLTEAATDATKKAEQYANALLDSIDDKIKAVEKEKQALEDEKQVLQDQLDILEEQQKAIEEQIENYKTVVGVIEDEINKQTEALKKQQEAEEEAIQAKIDALKEEREQKEAEEEILEKELAVQEKLRDLEKAKNTKVRTYSSARGWHYDVDKEAVSNAQSAVSEAQKAYDEAVEKREYEKQLKDLEEQKAAVSKSYEERIKEYEDYTEQWKSLLEEQSNAEEERLADEILGVNWREKIKEKDVNILTGFQTKFRQYNTDLSNLVNNEIGSLKKSIKAKEDEIKAIGDTINKWNDYKTQVQDAINTVNNKFNDMKNVVGDLKTYMTADNSDLDNIESRVATFASNYSAYMELATQNANNYTNAIYEQNDALEKNADKLNNDIQVWEGMIDAIKRFREQGIGINGESDAAYYSGEDILSMHWNDEQKRVSSYADGGVIDYTGTANVHGSKQKSEIALSAAQGRSLYDMIRTGNFSNLVASKAIEGLNRAMITNATTSNNNSTSVTIQSMNINGVQNPAQFAKEFNKNMEQYLQNEIIKSKVR